MLRHFGIGMYSNDMNSLLETLVFYLNILCHNNDVKYLLLYFLMVELLASELRAFVVE